MIKTRSTAMLFAFCLLLTGCGVGIENIPDESNFSIQGTQTSEELYNGSILSDFRTEGTHLEGQLSDKLYMNFEYQESDLSVSALPELTTKDIFWDKMSLIESLAEEKIDESKLDVSEYKSGQMESLYSIVETSDGACHEYVDIYELSPQEVISLIYETEFSYDIFGILRTKGYPETSILDEEIQYDNTTRFFGNDDLSFMTREEAINYMKTWLKDLGLSFQQDPKVFSIDAKSLKSVQNFLKESKRLDELRSEGVKERSWDIEDECYYMEFSMGYYDVPVYQYEEFDSSNMVILGGYVKALLSAEGIQSLSIYRPYGMIDFEGTSRKLISLDEALAQLKARFDKMIITYNEYLTGCYLCYIPYNGKDRIVMKPAWCMEISISMPGQDVNDDEVTIYHPQTLFLDAATGEWINTYR